MQDFDFFFYNISRQFAADYAQNWIVKCLEKRAANYKTGKPAHSGVQDIPVETTSPPPPPKEDEESKDKSSPESPTSDYQLSRGNSLKNRRNSVGADGSKATPSIRRKLQFDVSQTPEGHQTSQLRHLTAKLTSDVDLQARNRQRGNHLLSVAAAAAKMLIKVDVLVIQALKSRR